MTPVFSNVVFVTPITLRISFSLLPSSVIRLPTSLKLYTCSMVSSPIFKPYRYVLDLLITTHLVLALFTESLYSSLFLTPLSRRTCSVFMLSANMTLSCAMYISGDWSLILWPFTFTFITMTTLHYFILCILCICDFAFVICNKWFNYLLTYLLHWSCRWLDISGISVEAGEDDARFDASAVSGQRLLEFLNRVCRVVSRGCAFFHSSSKCSLVFLWITVGE